MNEQLFSVDAIIKAIDSEVEVIGEKCNIFISNIKPLDSADSQTLVWIKSNKKDLMDCIMGTMAKVIIVDKENRPEAVLPEDKCLLLCENPKLAITQVYNKLLDPKELSMKIHPSVIIHPEAEIESGVYIGPNSVIGNAVILKGTYISNNCVIEDNVKIGQNVKVGSGTVIGEVGFGFATDSLGNHYRFPHIGKVIIEDNVEIGANVCIDRAALDSTTIGSGTKIDNLCQIGHNVTIGTNCIITGNSIIGGSCKVGDNVWIGLSSSLKEGIIIGNNAFISMGSVVVRNIGNNQKVIGNPAKLFQEYVSDLVRINRLFNKNI